MKTKKIQLVALALVAAFIISITGIFGSLFRYYASAATYSPGSLFTSPDTGEVKGEANEALKLVFKDGSTLRYNRDLAYRWVIDNDDNDVYDAGVNYFSMEFSFDTVDFTEFSVKFQSAENSVTKEDVADNEIIFFENGQFAFRDAYSKDVETEALDKVGTATDLTGKAVSITFGAGENSGEYAVTVSVEGQEDVVDTFTNIAGTYAEYVVSEVIPLSFTATLKDGADEQKVSFKELNRQTFVLDESGKVADNAAPVLALNDDVKSFILGTKILNFTYETIDVCDSTVTTTIEYYQYNPEDTAAEWTTLTTSVKVFETVITVNDVKTSVFAENGAEYVSIRFILNDDSGNSLTYYVADYADEAEDQYEKTVGEDTYNFTAVIMDDEGPAYTFYQKVNDNTANFVEEDCEAFKDAYQSLVDKAAEEQRAGDGYYFYLPSLEDYIEDNDTSYTGLKFNVYYKSTSTGSQTNLAYNGLRIPVSSAGKYVFKVVATDKSGNAMQYLNDDGRWENITSDNIWDIDEIPSFTFTAENRGLEIEDLEEASYAYKGSNYSATKFTVKGSGYEDEFFLYYLDGVNAGDITYSQMVSFANGYHDEDFVAALKTEYSTIDSQAAFVEINPWDSDGPLDEDDDGWEEHDNYYEWRTSSFSFTPRDTGYYVIAGKYVDNDTTQVVYAYEVIYVSSEVDRSYGEIYWIEDNVVTVVFIVIAAVSLIGIVVLLIVKPADKTAEPADGKKKAGKFSSKKGKKDEE